MNPKLKLVLIIRLSDRGFVLPIVLGIGLIMLLVGATIMVRSQSDQNQVNAQKTTSEGISLAEVGVTRYQELLNENRYIALYPDCATGRDTAGVCQDGTTATSWANAVNLPQLTACKATEATNVSAVALNADWTNVNPDDPDQGQYRIISYQFSPKLGEAPGIGILTVEGRVKQSNNNSTSASRLQVEIPVQPGSPKLGNIPGVWLQTGGTGKNTIQGDVLLGDCGAALTDVSVTGSDPTTGEAYKAEYTSFAFPDLPPQPTTATNLGTLTGQDYELPRVGDSPITKTINGKQIEVYEYLVDAVDLKSGNHTLLITPGKHVTLYLKGNIESGGEIIHSCTDGSNQAIAGCQPTDFQIFGYGDESKYICTLGNKAIETFILAPKYTVGTAGTGGGEGGIKGSVWAKAWSNGPGCGSETSNVVVAQEGRWEDIGLQPKNTPPTISSATSWQRQER